MVVQHNLTAMNSNRMLGITQGSLSKSAEKLSEKLSGMTIVISGNFSISRDEMKALIAAHGGKNSGSVSGKTTYLLAGEKAGPEKLKKAESLDVKVITEDEFYSMINNSEMTVNIGNSSSERVSEIKPSDEPTLF